MILVLLAVGLLIAYIGLELHKECDYDSIGDIASAPIFVVGVLTAIGSFIVTIVLLLGVIDDATIDEKIAMYYEENAKIEAQVDDIVERYMEYESETFEISPDDSSLVIASLYPELKSNTLVESQIEVYVENNEKIKELKEGQIGASARRWWLYFGK